jgi:multiple antibiotic resistance protein
MDISFKNVVTISMILFAVIDIIGSIPVIIEIRRRAGSIHPEKATLTSLLIMLLFLFLGENILKLIGLDISSFAIAGAFVLFFISLEMILGIKLHKNEMPETASIVPIAFPLIAGAGTMTTLLSLRSEFKTEEIIIGIIFNLTIVYFCLKNLRFLEKLLGPTGIGVVQKVFGFILLAIAVKLFRTNVGI